LQFQGHISLNWKLVAAPEPVARYVVIHELAHLKHGDHSKRFWNLVEDHCPDLKSHKQWIRKNNYTFDFLAKSPELHP